MTTRADFSKQCLIAATGVNRRGAHRALCAWSIAESGTRPCDGDVGANWNPWNTTLQLPGSTFYNLLASGIGVQNYTSAAQGAQAFAKTLHGDVRYATLLEVLARKYVSVKTVFLALDASPWGTHEPLLTAVRERYAADMETINELPVGS
jgi:hypothetical protein